MSDPLLDPKSIGLSLRRIAGEIVERGSGVDDLALIGIRRGGEPFAARLAKLIEELEGTSPPVGSVDITLYRDDAATAWPNPRIGPSNIPFSVAGRRIVLVDDVVSTGRTVRAAFDAVLDYGRPKRIELVALIDRGGRELPIQPDYCARKVEVMSDRRIEVEFRDDAGKPMPHGEGEPWAVVREPGESGPASAPSAGDGDRSR